MVETRHAGGRTGRAHAPYARAGCASRPAAGRFRGCEPHSRAATLIGEELSTAAGLSTAAPMLIAHGSTPPPSCPE
jgi:hypothetical protein